MTPTQQAAAAWSAPGGRLATALPALAAAFAGVFRAVVLRVVDFAAVPCSGGPLRGDFRRLRVLVGRGGLAGAAFWPPDGATA